jgi:nicotinate dehydrogenase subunit B
MSGQTRRDFLRSGGVLVVGLGTLSVTEAASLGLGPEFATAQGAGPYPDPDFRQIDTWIAIRPDNTATFYVGKTDLGQGTGTAFRQMMASELDFPYERTTCVMGSTDVTPDQGGSGGSDAIQTDGWPMRYVAAEARRVLLDMGATHFGVPVAALTVADGVVSLAAEPAKRVTYGALIGGRKFNVTLAGGKNVDQLTGVAKLKPVHQLKYVGQSPARYDIPPKVDGTAKWAVDVKLPGMVHARNVKPPMAGATLVSVDEASVNDVPGLVRVLRKGNYVAVVCEREEHAIRAARQLKCEWSAPASAPFPASEGLFDHMRAAAPTFSAPPMVVGDPDAAFASAAKVIEAEYQIPFQGHTAIGPAHATADPSDGQMTIYSNDMKSYGLRNGVAQFLGLPRDRVRVIWLEGPQAYGRTAADDAGFEAAWIAKEIGRPVRVQWMRNEETAWDTKGPAFLVKMRGALDAEGRLQAFEWDARSCDHNHVGYNEPDSVLIAQLQGVRRTPSRGSAGLPDAKYFIPHRRQRSHVVSLPLVFETPLRTGNMRDPNGPQITYAAEAFIDELAAAAGQDPVAFRLALLKGSTEEDQGFKRARSIAVVEAAAKAYGWEPRPAASRRGTGEVLTGRGFAYSFRSQTVAAQVAEVEVHATTGRVWVKRLVCAHDCGLVINPEGLRRTIEGGMLHSLSRALYEEVRFDTQKVTSVDWRTHPTLTHQDTPARIDVVIVNGDPNPDRPDLPHYGAGETVCKPLIPAVANAIYDATGVRLRRVPFRPERVLAALKAARA